MSSVDWKKEYLDLYHVARNLQIALAQDLRVSDERRRRTDQYVNVLGEQLEDLMDRIPDDAFKDAPSVRLSPALQKDMAGVKVTVGEGWFAWLWNKIRRNK